jgi:hypothetical protein
MVLEAHFTLHGPNKWGLAQNSNSNVSQEIRPEGSNGTFSRVSGLHTSLRSTHLSLGFMTPGDSDFRSQVDVGSGLDSPAGQTQMIQQ